MTKRTLMKYIVSIIFSLLTVCLVSAQNLEIGVMGGGSYYYGDIVNEWTPSTIGGSGGVFLRYHINENMAIKGFGGYCKISGSDSLSSSSYQRNRNLSFWADVFEGSVQFEYSFVKDITRGRRLRNRFIPYAFAGLGAFYFMNYAYGPSHEIVKLYNMGTSGTVYNNFSVCVPFGVGFRYKITSNINLGMELGIRYTATTWLDDVGGPTTFYKPYTKENFLYNIGYLMSDRSTSQQYIGTGKQRGKVALSDVYVMCGFTLGYRLGTGGGGGGYRGRAIRCPRFY